MSTFHPVELVIEAAEKLGVLRNEVVFLGGAVVGLLVTDQATRAPRSTVDVDVAIKVGNLVDYYQLDERLRAIGFTNDMRGPVCRYLHGTSVIDVMPTEPDVLGFANRRYPLSLQTAHAYTLSSGITINLITAPCFLATKLEAFSDPAREGHKDIFVSRDFEDIIRVIDGRSTIVDEILASPIEIRTYLQERFAQLQTVNYLEEAIAEHVDKGREGIVIDRMSGLQDGQRTE